MKQQKIYISGAITNVSTFEREFNNAQQFLRQVYPDAIIYNPVNIPGPKFDQDDWGMDSVWKYYMIEALKMLLECDTVFMLRSWTFSRGAKIEHELAQDLGLKIIYEENFPQS